MPQTDLQKSVLSFRLGYSVGAKWLEAQDSLPRFRTLDQCNFQLSLSKIPTPDIPAISHWSHKNMWGQVISGGRKAHLDPPWRSTSKHIPARLFFFSFHSATLGRSLKFWKLSISGFALAAYKRKY